MYISYEPGPIFFDTWAYWLHFTTGNFAKTVLRNIRLELML